MIFTQMSLPARLAQSGQFRSLEGSSTTAEVPPKNDDDSREEVGCFINDSCESDNPPRPPSDGGYLGPGIGMVLFGVSVYAVLYHGEKGSWVYLYCILTCFCRHSRIQLVHVVIINFILVCNYILCMHL